MDELYKGSVLVNKVAPWSLLIYRKLKFFQFPKESWTILDFEWNIIKLLEKMEDIGWIQGRWNLVELHWGEVKQVILVAWKLQTWPKGKKIDYEKGNIIKIINLNLKMNKNLWYVILKEKFRAKVKAIYRPIIVFQCENIGFVQSKVLINFLYFLSNSQTTNFKY
jgi:hypothetical protein